jgi:hypothetical protein
MTSTSMENVYRPVLLGLMVLCVVLSLVALLELFFPDWNGAYLAVFCGCTAAEACYSTRLYQRRVPHAYGGAGFRLPELGALFVLLQLCGDLADGQAPLQDGVPHVDAKTFGLFCLVFVCWLAATATTRDLDRAGEPPDAIFGYVAPTQRVVRRFFWGGVLLFAAAGLTQASIDQTLKLPVPARSGPLLNVLLYFALGMLMVAQVRYAALRRRWEDHEIPVAVGLADRWLRYSLAFVGLAMFAALLLPTSRTLGLVELGRALWGPFSAAAAQIVTAIGRLLMRFGVSYRPHAPVRHVVPPSLPPLKHLPHAASVHRKAGHSPGSHWSWYVQLLLFWTSVLAGAVCLVRSCLRGRVRGWRLTGTVTSTLAVLTRAWIALWHWLSYHARVVGDLVPRRLDLRKRSSAPPGGLLPFDSFGGLSARKQVQRYYLNMVRRAAERGVSRRASQTPHEFIHTLAHRVPDAESDIYLLTGAFVEARYSAHPVEAPQVQRVRESWHRVRAALRARGERIPKCDCPNVTKGSSGEGVGRVP